MHSNFKVNGLNYDRLYFSRAGVLVKQLADQIFDEDELDLDYTSDDDPDSDDDDLDPDDFEDEPPSLPGHCNPSKAAAISCSIA